MATGILSVLLSVLPMAAGVAMGKGLQGSLYWGLSVINGGKDDETEATDSLVENTELSTHFGKVRGQKQGWRLNSQCITGRGAEKSG